MAILNNMTSTEIAAWWGAIIASVVLIWDMYKWKIQGPRLLMVLSPNMLVLGDPSREGKTWVSVVVTNIGDRPTTIKGVGMEYYTNWYKRLRNQADKAATFPNPSDRFPLPRVLTPGDEWNGLIPQERQGKVMNLEEMSQSGHLMIWLSRSDRKQALRKRIIIINDS